MAFVNLDFYDEIDPEPIKVVKELVWAYKNAMLSCESNA